MSDSEDELPTRGMRRVLEAPRRWKRPLSRSAVWVRETADRLVVQRLEADIVRLLQSLTEPENARRLQSAMAHVAQFAMERGFEADPHAERLYALVAWLEERHGRPPVLRVVAGHIASTETTLLSGLGSLVGDLGQPGGSGGMEDAARRMHEMRDEAASDLLDLLCGLAALETGDEPPRGSAEARVAFFEAADLPDEFRSLAAMAAGTPGAFAEPPKERGTSLLRRLRGKQTTPGSGLARFVPSFEDPHLRFLTLSHFFFLQSYLTRNLVEALPELLSMADQRTHE